MRHDAPALEVMDLAVPFGDQPGLAGVDFRIAAGERMALVGASGAGKSSLLRVIAGAAPALAGTIRVGGLVASGRSPRDRDVVLLEQRPLLFPHLSVRRNVAFPLEVRGVTGPELDRRVHEALESVEMASLSERRPGSLSGGQAHRVALARAVVANPTLLLLDEPFTGLDPELRARLQRTVVAVTERYRTALLLVTHDLQEAGRVADRIGVLLDRRLARLATPAALYRDPGSVLVARFIGWPNVLPVERVSDRTVQIGDLTWTSDTPLPPGEDLRLLFGRDGGRLVPESRPGAESASAVGPDAGEDATGLAVEVLSVEHEPHGATARWVSRDLFTPAEASLGDGAERVRGEVLVDPTTPPTPGRLCRLQLHPDRVRIHPALASDPSSA